MDAIICGVLMVTYVALFVLPHDSIQLAPSFFAGSLSPNGQKLLGAGVKALPILLLALASRDRSVRAERVNNAGLAAYAGHVAKGLVMCAIGDFLLDAAEIPGREMGFLVGIGAFLMGHIWYIVSFTSIGSRKLQWPLVVACVLYPAGLIAFLYPKLVSAKEGNLFGPVLVYGVSMRPLFGWGSLFRKCLPCPPLGSSLRGQSGHAARADSQRALSNGIHHHRPSSRSLAHPSHNACHSFARLTSN